jgi:hypothetical protein
MSLSPGHSLHGPKPPFRIGAPWDNLRAALMAKRGQFKTGQRMRLEQSSFIPFCPVGPVRASPFWFVSFAGHI